MKEFHIPAGNIRVRVDEVTMSGSLTSDLYDWRLSDSENDLLAAFNGIESLILAHACNGIDVSAPAYADGVRTALETCENKLGD